MAKISRDLSLGTLHPRETIWQSAPLSSLNAEIQIASDAASTVTLETRGTFTAVVAVQGSNNGVDWTVIPMRPIGQASLAYALNQASLGVYVGRCASYRLVRAICTSFTSGSANTVLAADAAELDDTLQDRISPFCVPNAATVGLGMTISLPSAGFGLRHYITFMRFTRTAAGLLVAGTTPILITTTNLPGNPVYAMGAEADPQGKLQEFSETLNFAIPSVLTNVPTTFVFPATTNVVWRGQVQYYVGP